MQKLILTEHMLNLKTLPRIFGSSKNNLARKKLFLQFNMASKTEAEGLNKLLKVMTSRYSIPKMKSCYYNERKTTGKLFKKSRIIKQIAKYLVSFPPRKVDENDHKLFSKQTNKQKHSPGAWVAQLTGFQLRS